jgi:predicted RNase H-like HicB family nuclease
MSSSGTTRRPRRGGGKVARMESLSIAPPSVGLATLRARCDASRVFVSRPNRRANPGALSVDVRGRYSLLVSAGPAARMRHACYAASAGVIPAVPPNSPTRSHQKSATLPSLWDPGTDLDQLRRHLRTRCGRWSAYVPDVPGCVSTAATREEVEQLMPEAVVHVDLLRSEGLEVPAPSAIAGVVAA